MKTLHRTLGLAALIMATTAVGCSPYGALCDDEIACRGGNDADYDACVISYEANEDKSDIYGCDARLDDYLACLDRNVHCNNDNWTHDGDCNNEQKDFFDCIH